MFPGLINLLELCILYKSYCDESLGLRRLELPPFIEELLGMSARLRYKLINDYSPSIDHNPFLTHNNKVKQF